MAGNKEVIRTLKVEVWLAWKSPPFTGLEVAEIDPRFAAEPRSTCLNQGDSAELVPATRGHLTQDEQRIITSQSVGYASR